MIVVISVVPVFWHYGAGCRAPQSTDRRDESGEAFGEALDRGVGEALVAALASRGIEWRGRDEWGASEPTRAVGALGAPTRVTIHHSGDARAYTRTAAQDVAASSRAIQRSHQGERGWGDIGYHLVIDPVGRIWEGRESVFVGAHAGSAELNRANLGIVLLGNFEKQRPTPAQLSRLEAILDVLQDLCAIEPSEIHSHNEIRTAAGLAGTLCPGKHLMSHLLELRK